MKGRVHGADLERRKLHDKKGHRSWNDKKSLMHHKDALKLAKLGADMVPTPSWLTDEQAKIFEYMRDTVVMLDIAAVSDRYSLEMLCTQYTQYIELTKTIADEGFMIVVETPKGDLVNRPHPLLTEKNRAYNAVKTLFVEFGMTPNSRRTVLKRDPDTADNSEEEEWDDLLN